MHLTARKPRDPAYPAALLTLGDHIRKKRLDLGLRQSDVANQIGVYTSTLNIWETHHFKPDVQHIPRIIAFLGYNPFGPLPPSFPLRLKAIRREAGLTRRELAKRLGVHPATVAEWERGNKEPNEQNQRRLAGFGPLPPGR